MPVTHAEVDELFSTPPTQFISVRNELAKRARAEKQEELAKEISSLRKPTVTVWLLNQLGRRYEGETAALLQAGEKLRRAQTAALRGVGPEPLREATNAWRAAISSAVKRAREILKTAGGRQRLEEPRLVATLLGAVADTKNAELLKRGKLTEELEPPGFEAALGARGAGPAKLRTAARLPKQDEGASHRMRVAEEQRRREAATALNNQEREAAKAEKTASRAEREAARLEARAAQVLERAARAREIAAAARKRAADSREAVEDLRRRTRT